MRATQCNYCGNLTFPKTIGEDTEVACVNPECAAFDEEALDECNGVEEAGPLDASDGTQFGASHV